MKRNILPIAFIVLLITVGFYFLSKQQVKAPVTPSSSPISRTISPPDKNNALISGIFEGITPCSNVERPLPQIPANANCEMTIWHITFHPDATYILNSSYGMTQPGTPGIKGGGTRVTMEGMWTIVRGTKTDPDAIVVQLHSNNPQHSVSFLKVSDDLVHLLDGNKSLMVGNGAWSYTLNKTSR